MKMGKKLLISTVTLAAVVIALFLAPVGAQPSRQTECSFAGLRRTTYGEMPLQQSGASVAGTYGAQAVKRVEGTFREGVLTGSWSHPPTFSAENNQAGDVEFRIASNCETFEGRCKRCNQLQRREKPRSGGPG